MMESRENQVDRISENQRRLVERIQKSHRLFKAQFYSNFAILLLLIPVYAYMLTVEWEIFTLFILIFPFIPLVAQYKRYLETFRFIKWGDKLFQKLGSQRTGFLQGITTYIHRLYKVTRLSRGLRVEEISSQAPGPEVVEKLEKELNDQKKMLIILGSLVLGTFMLVIGTMLYAGTGLIIAIIGLVALGIIPIVYVALRWRHEVKRWLLVYKGMIAWGRALEEKFGNPQKHEGEGDQ